MANYKESSLSGSEHTRCCEVHIINPFQETPMITFVEQKVTILSDGKILTEKGDSITVPFDPSKVIKEFDVINGQQLEATVSYFDLYKDICSAYMAAAIERDTNAQ